MKDKIIYHVLEFIDTSDLSHANTAKTLLQDLAKEYHLKIAKTAKIDIKRALKEFVLNGKGYVETISRLYNSIG